MKVEKKDLPKSQVELLVELSAAEFEPYIKKGAEAVSRDIKIDGFRPGNVPMDVLKSKIGEMTILEEAARIAINKTIDQVIKDNVQGQPVGQPRVDITKLAPQNSLEYKVVLALLPEVTLGDYQAVKVKAKKTTVDDKEAEKIINDLREMRVKEAVADRGAKEGDKALIDIEMFLNKVPVEGGQSKDTAVIIGKNYIVPGFDKHLIGIKKGDTREFSLPYPADHHMKNLAGKMVEFKITVKEIYQRELPELNDKFAAGFGLKKIEELKENVKKSVIDQKEKENEQATEKELLDKIAGKAKFGDIPEMLVEHETETMMAEIEQSLANQGAKFEDYLSSIKKTKEQFMLDILPEAVKRVKVSLLLREIGIKENIRATNDEVEKHIEEMKKYYTTAKTPQSKEILERINAPEYKGYVANVLTSRKIIDKLKEQGIEK